MSKNDTVLFVVLNYNGWRETIPCLDAIFAQDYPSYGVYLVENGSRDESVRQLKRYEHDLRVVYVKNKTNLGFDGGVNMGIRHAIDHGYPYLVLLNNDAIIEKDWLSKLMTSLVKADASVVTGLLLLGDGTRIESTSDSISSWGLPFPRQRDEPADTAHDSGYVFGGTAGASLYKTDVFKKIGLFDENFFAYFEDTDINFQLQLAGHKTYYEKSAVAYHNHGTTSSKIPGFVVYQTFKNLPMFFWKNIPSELILSVGIKFFIYYALLYLRCLLRGQFISASRGVIRSISLLPHAFRERRRIQASRVVTIEYITSLFHKGLPPKNRATLRRVLHI